MRSTNIEQVASEIFRIEMPMKNLALKSVNLYVIRGLEKNLIIDTGLDREECFKIILDGVKALGINLQITDLFITHMHGDHIGLVEKMWTPHNEVYLNRLEIETIRNFLGFDPIIKYRIKHGFPREKVKTATERFRVDTDSIVRRGKLDYHSVDNWDQIKINDKRFICIHTPGHSKGHTCLYEPNEKILISGDHILGDITPGIECISDKTNPLSSYLKSLAEVKKLDLSIILPGHRSLIRDPLKRINELEEHHQKRLEEIIQILNGSPGTAYYVASKMKWDLPYKSWNEVPDDQKWFAVGEAISHLRYLEDQGMVKRNGDSKTVVFNITEDS